MDDLGSVAGDGGKVCQLGGGNPAWIPEVAEELMKAVRDIASDPALFRRFATAYSGPEGDRSTREVLAEWLSPRLSSALSWRNIALCAGTQSTLYALFNLFSQAGPGEESRVVLPMSPEYLGYVGLTPAAGLRTVRARIEEIGANRFKYRVDLGALSLDERDVALCVSRPSNPSGNVLGDAEVRALLERASGAGIPLILDSAYGNPFPGIDFTQGTPGWQPGMVLCLSLSKLGLPAVRTGIVVADEAVVDAVANVTATTALAPPSTGAVIADRLIRSGAFERVIAMVRPFYERRRDLAVEWLDAAFAGLPYRLHVPEGGFFLWLWLPTLKIRSSALYEQLAQRGVVVVPGEHFFAPDEVAHWPHATQCLRINYAQSEPDVLEGLRLIRDVAEASLG